MKDGGADLVRCLEAIARQRIDEEVEVVVVDSGSRRKRGGGAPARRARARDRRRRVPPRPHAEPRCEPRARRDVSSSRARTRTRPTRAGSRRSRAAPLEPRRRRRLRAAAPPRRRHPSRAVLPRLPLRPGRAACSASAGPGEPTFEATLFSNVNAALAAAVWSEFPVRGRHDHERGSGVVEARPTRGLERSSTSPRGRPPLACVHRRQRVPALLRLRGLGRALVCERRRRTRIGAAERGGRYAKGELAWLWRTGQRRWIPYTAGYELAKFSGLQLAPRHRRLPVSPEASAERHEYVPGMPRRGRPGLVLVEGLVALFAYSTIAVLVRGHSCHTSTWRSSVIPLLTWADGELAMDARTRGRLPHFGATRHTHWSAARLGRGMR